MRELNGSSVSPKSLIESFGTYDSMFRRLLGEGLDYRTYPVFEKVFPGDPEGLDGILITGSLVTVADARKLLKR